MRASLSSRYTPGRASNTPVGRDDDAVASVRAGLSAVEEPGAVARRAGGRASRRGAGSVPGVALGGPRGRPAILGGRGDGGDAS